MVDVVGKRALFFGLSLALIAVGLVVLAASPKLRWSIEFTSGAVATVSFIEPVPKAEIDALLSNLGYQQGVVQPIGDEGAFIRVPVREDEEDQRETLRQALVERFGELEAFDFALVSPIVAQETVRNGLFAVLAAVVGILIYVTWAFRSVPSPLRYGVAAIVALVHDVTVVVAVAGIVAQFIPIEISTMFLVGVLTVLGYSVNDTIVVFDRVRENLLRETSRGLVPTVNFSILETLGRSINTSFTTVLVLLTLLVLGPVTVRDFLVVMTVGVVTGTYSSIFIASQVLVSWETGSLGSLPRWVPLIGRSSA